MAGTYLLIWDAPNMDMGLGAILGGRPTAVYRPRFDAIGRWLVYEARSFGAEPEATVFTNVAPGGADVIRPWVEAIRNVGFAVFAKPKLNDGIPVTVLGFHEHASWAVGADHIDFVDLEDIPGTFREPLPRVSLDDLPDEGAWLQPFRSISALVDD